MDLFFGTAVRAQVALRGGTVERVLVDRSVLQRAMQSDALRLSPHVGVTPSPQKLTSFGAGCKFRSSKKSTRASRRLRENFEPFGRVTNVRVGWRAIGFSNIKPSALFNFEPIIGCVQLESD